MKKSSEDMVQIIYKDIKYKIITQELKANDRLIETKLASEYHASRLHVKEALRLLELEQLAKHIPRCGVIVMGITNETLKEIADLRQALEGLVVRTIMPNITDDFLIELEQIYKRFEAFLKCGLINDSLDEAHLFYHKIYELCPYKRVISILDTYADYIDVIMKLTITTKANQLDGVENLQGILNALKSRNLEDTLYQFNMRHKHLYLSNEINHQQNE